MQLAAWFADCLPNGSIMSDWLVNQSERCYLFLSHHPWPSETEGMRGRGMEVEMDWVGEGHRCCANFNAEALISLSEALRPPPHSVSIPLSPCSKSFPESQICFPAFVKALLFCLCLMQEWSPFWGIFAVTAHECLNVCATLAEVLHFSQTTHTHTHTRSDTQSTL